MIKRFSENLLVKMQYKGSIRGIEISKSFGVSPKVISGENHDEEYIISKLMGRVVIENHDRWRRVEGMTPEVLIFYTCSTYPCKKLLQKLIIEINKDSKYRKYQAPFKAFSTLTCIPNLLAWAEIWLIQMEKIKGL